MIKVLTSLNRKIYIPQLHETKSERILHSKIPHHPAILTARQLPSFTCMLKQFKSLVCML